MVLLNGQEFVIYGMDSHQTIIERIAVILGTLPKYVSAPLLPDLTQEDPNQLDFNIVAQDLLTRIRDYNNQGNVKSNVGDFLNQLRQENLWTNLDQFEIASLWITYNNRLTEARFTLAQRYADRAFSQDPPIPKPRVIQLRQNSANKRQEIQREIELFRTRTENMTNILTQLDRIQPKPFTGLKLSTIVREIKIPKGDIQTWIVTLSQLFDLIQLHKTTPFASLGTFYKIFHDFTSPPEWSITMDETIILRTLMGPEVFMEETDKVKNNNYSEALITLDEENIIFRLQAMVGEQGYNYVRDRTFSVFANNLGLENIPEGNQVEIKGIFYYPQQKLNKYVLADLIMNDSVFSGFLSIDESIKATKQKSAVYVYYSDPGRPDDEITTASITEKVAQFNDPVFRTEFREMFSVGEKYLRVKITRTKNLETLEKFQGDFGKFLVIYNSQFNNIVNIYRHFVPNFGVEEPIVIAGRQERTLADIEPKLFIALYTRRCGDPPIIVPEDELDEYRNRGYVVMEPDENGNLPDFNSPLQIMKYPMGREGEYGTPRYYACEHENNKWPGLRKNRMTKNQHLFPFLPCCYEVNNLTKSNPTYYQKYLEGRVIEDVRAVQPHIIGPYRFASHEGFGQLPPDLNTLFEALDPEMEYLRLGVHNTKSSFLECVLIAKNIPEEDINAARNNLAEFEHLSVGRQELYDMDSRTIKEFLRDQEQYLDPKIFIRILEVVYDINIFLFARDESNPNGGMIVPRHVQGYYKYQENKEIVLIYEHRGSEADETGYPRCELIVRKMPTEEYPIYIYPQGSYPELSNMFRDLSKSYVLDRELFDIILPPLDIVAQGIDSYGKTRYLRVRFRDRDINLSLSPIPPLNITELPLEEFLGDGVDMERALGFAASIEMPVLRQSLNSDQTKVQNITGRIGNVLISIRIAGNTDPLGGVPPGNDIVPSAEFSVIKNFDQNKRLARYLTEYFLYLFSTFLEQISLEDAIEKDELLRNFPETFSGFVDDFIEIRENYNYGDVKEEFSPQSGVMRGGKLVLRNNEILKRLAYLLRVKLVREKNDILGYYFKTVIPNYYVNSTDLISYPGQVVLKGLSSLEKWNSEKKYDFTLEKKVLVDRTIPYFFKNPLVDASVHLAQNTESIAVAKDVSITWNRDGYDILGVRTNREVVRDLGREPGADAQRTDIGYSLLSYRNYADITRYRVRGDVPTNIEILGYKVDGNPRFTSLLVI